MGEANPSVLVIDDDAEFRDSVCGYCGQSAYLPNNFRLFPIFSRPIRRTVPLAWCST